MQIRHLAIALATALHAPASFAADAPGSPPAEAAVSVPSQRAPAGWRLVWSDEFDRAGAPDSGKWGFESGFVRNDELQYYTRDRRENARVEDGCLVLELRREKYPNSQYDPARRDGGRRRGAEYAGYTSASLTTERTAGWQYARVEVRAKLPTGRGFWPAIWMLGTNMRQAGWPRCGEIDIMENVGFAPDTIHGTVHTGAYNHVRKTARGATAAVPKPHEAFHVYAMEWNAEALTIEVDGRPYFTFRNEGKGVDTWPFDQKMYLILNVAFGGAWGGQKGIDETIGSGRMLIDWVRVYQR